MATVAHPRVRVRRPDRWVLIVGILATWIVLWTALKGRNTLFLSPSSLTDLHRWLNDVNDSIGASRDTNPLFVYVFDPIRVTIDTLVAGVQELIAQPYGDRPVPLIGWLGVVAIVTYISWVFGNGRVAILAGAGFVFLGLQGLWVESMDTLALTLSAVVLALLIGIPLGIWAGLSPRVLRLVTPVLDLMQTMPTFVYLAPLTLFFLIGPASATIATFIYAMPPAIRLTAHGIRSVSPTTVEATESMGSTARQTLGKVQLPMAKRTIVLGINQTMMAALAMVTIAALIDAPGLGEVVINALETLDVGTAFNAGLAIVVLAIVLDRVTTAASLRAENERRREGATGPRSRRPLVIGGGVVTAVCVYLSYTYLWAAEFPDEMTIGGTTVDLNVGQHISSATDSATDWAQDTLSPITNGFRDLVTTTLLNPFESLLTQSPWWLVGIVIVALGAVLGGRAAAIPAVICVALLVGSGLWRDAMTTLASTLVATVIVMIIAVVFGVWMGRSSRVDGIIRPIADAAQVMPPFVYLVPVLALFSPTRFTAIVAAIVYATPVAMKIIADGIRSVPPTTVEAAISSGSSRWQVIRLVQLPMSRAALTLATNQGLIYVLSMVVVGGLVGAGALGYDVVAGFSQLQLYGKGLAAGFAIVLLGVMLDRISQAAARRAGSPSRAAP